MPSLRDALTVVVPTGHRGCQEARQSALKHHIRDVCVFDEDAAMHPSNRHPCETSEPPAIKSAGRFHVANGERPAASRDESAALSPLVALLARLVAADLAARTVERVP